jgi:alpha-ribazole phosphatase
MDVTTRWWWVRHAPVINPSGQLYGQTDLDPDLSDDDRFRHIAGQLPADAVWITTPLTRARQTAEKLVDLKNHPDRIGQDTGLREQSFGDWEGGSWETIPLADKTTYWQDPVKNRPPNGESFADVVGRVGAAITRLIDTHSGRDIVIVAHAGSIRAALSHATGGGAAVGLSFRLDPLSLTRIDTIQRDNNIWWRVESVNLGGVTPSI